jgi:hypothetical protein
MHFLYNGSMGLGNFNYCSFALFVIHKYALALTFMFSLYKEVYKSMNMLQGCGSVTCLHGSCFADVLR